MRSQAHYNAKPQSKVGQNAHCRANNPTTAKLRAKLPLPDTTEEEPLVAFAVDPELVAEDPLAVGLLVDALPLDDPPLDLLPPLEAPPVAPNCCCPAVIVTGKNCTSVPLSVVVATPGAFALSPPALVTHTAVVADVSTSQLQLKLKDSPGGVMLACQMEVETCSTDMPGPRPQSEASSPEGHCTKREVVAALAVTTEATSGSGSVSTRKAVMVAFCAREREMKSVERIEMVERRCILIAIKIIKNSMQGFLVVI